MGGSTGGVTGTEHTFNGGHVGVTPEIFTLGGIGLQIFRTGDPGAGGTRVRTDKVRFGSSDFGGFLFRFHVAGSPKDGL